MRTIAAPAPPAPGSAGRSRAWLPTSMPRVGSESTSTSRSRASTRPSTTFCWLPPDSVVMRRSGDGGADVVALDRRAHAPALGARVEHARARELARPRDGEVLGHAARRQQRGPLAVVGHEADPARERGCAAARGRRAGRATRTLPWLGIAPASASPSSALPEPTSPATPTISPRRTRSVVGFEPAVARAQPVDLEHRLAVLDRALAVVVAQLTPDHQAHQLAAPAWPAAARRRRRRPSRSTVAVLAAPVELGQAVRDHQHGDAARAQALDHLQQPLASRPPRASSSPRRGSAAATARRRRARSRPPAGARRSARRRRGARRRARRGGRGPRARRRAAAASRRAAAARAAGGRGRCSPRR